MKYDFFGCLLIYSNEKERKLIKNIQDFIFDYQITSDSFKKNVGDFQMNYINGKLSTLYILGISKDIIKINVKGEVIL